MEDDDQQTTDEDDEEQPEVETTTERPAGMPLESDLADPVLESPEDAPPKEATEKTEPIDFVDTFALRVAAHPDYDREDFPDVKDAEITEALGYVEQAVTQARECRENAREERQEALKEARREHQQQARERAGWVTDDDGENPPDE